MEDKNVGKYYPLYRVNVDAAFFALTDGVVRGVDERIAASADIMEGCSK